MAAPKSAVTAPERTPVVILFAETSGFTRTSAMLQPSVVLARVSEFSPGSGGGPTAGRHRAQRVERYPDGVLRGRKQCAACRAGGTGDPARLQRLRGFVGARLRHPRGGRDRTARRRRGHRHRGRPEWPAAARHWRYRERCRSSASPRRAGEFVLSKTVMDALAATGFALDAESCRRWKFRAGSRSGCSGAARHAPGFYLGAGGRHGYQRGLPRGGRSVEFLDQINKASIVMLNETGIVPHAVAGRSRAG